MNGLWRDWGARAHSAAMRAMKLNILLVFFCCSAFLAAHPHVVIDYAVELRLDESGRPEGYSLSWIFDEEFSEEVLFEIDRNRDGFLDQEEVRQLKAFAFDNTASVHYFTSYQLGSGKVLEALDAQAFHADILGGRIRYRFFISFSPEALGTYRITEPISIWIVDPSYYTAFFPLEGMAETAASMAWKVELIEDRNYVYEYSANDRADDPMSRAYADRLDFRLDSRLD